MKRLLTATALTLALATAPYTWAAETHNTTPTTTLSVQQKQQLKDFVKASDQGYQAVHDIQKARVALFQGSTNEARQLLAQSQKLLSTDSTSWKQFVRTDKKAFADDNYVVINSVLALSEDYVATPEKQKAIKAANMKLKQGDHKGAIESLKLAGIGVSETQYLMPLKATQNAVTKANELMKQDKYYQANLVLKGTEDRIISDTLVW